VCCQEGEDGENHIRVGRLNLVDLAGSERQAKTKAEVSDTRVDYVQEKQFRKGMMIIPGLGLNCGSKMTE